MRDDRRLRLVLRCLVAQTHIFPQAHNPTRLHFLGTYLPRHVLGSECVLARPVQVGTYIVVL
jgi:hypothetical protein